MVSPDIGIYAPLSVANHHFPDSDFGLCSMDKSSGSAWGKRILIFVTKFLAVSLPLFALWIVGGYFYILPVLSVAEFFVQILGLQVSGLPMSLDIFSSPIPFISLMVITKHLEFRKRLSKIVIGLLILFLWHLAASMGLYLMMIDHQVISSKAILYATFKTFLYIFNLTLPFLLWFFFFGKKRIKAAIL
jgi:hypothetical protein